ncbi:MAG: inositol monophosphatase family protein, partial [Acidimicrobiales bacterium]
MDALGDIVINDLDLAHRLVSEAADLAVSYFGRENRIRQKSDGTPVGEADLAVDRLLAAGLSEHRPADGRVSEESGEVEGSSGRRWIIDPIDGTAAFISGGRHWGTHLALEQDGQIVLGIVSRPVLGQEWWALQGRGAFRSSISTRSPERDDRVELSAVSTLEGARITGWSIDSVINPILESAHWFDCEYNDSTAVLEGRAEVQVVPGHFWDFA